jgi:epoxyqueuosine reductase
VGCLHCQRVCPENRDFLEWVVGGEEFSPEETTLLLEGVPRDQLPTATVKKLERLDLIEYFDCLPRNLGVMLEKRDGQ